MGLLKYIQIKGLGGVDLTTRSLAEQEDNVYLDRTKGGQSRVQPAIEKSVLGHETELDLMVVPNTKDVPEKQQLEVSASSSKKRKFVVVVSTSSEDSKSHDNKDDAGECVSNKRGKKAVLSKPGDEKEEDDLKPDVRCLNQAGFVKNLVGSVPEFLKWHEKEAKKEVRLRSQISRYRLKMKLECAKNVKLSKKLKKLKNLKKKTLHKGKEVAKGEEKLKQAYEELELQREVVEKLNAELELKNETVDKLNAEIEVEKAGRTQERVSLENLLKRVLSERRWLIQEGFEYVINRLHKSGEYLGPLGAVQKKLWESGAHYGVEQGYECCKAGVALEDVSLYKSKAHEEFLKAVDELEHTRFPYVIALSQCADRKLDELKAMEPLEMEEGEDEVAVGGDKIM